MHFLGGIAVALRTLGRIAQADGDFTEAETYFHEALELFTAQDSLPQMGRIQLCLASLHQEYRDLHTAFTHLQAAHELFQTARLPIYVEQINQLARQWFSHDVDSLLM